MIRVRLSLLSLIDIVYVYKNQNSLARVIFNGMNKIVFDICIIFYYDKYIILEFCKRYKFYKR